MHGWEKNHIWKQKTAWHLDWLVSQNLVSIRTLKTYSAMAEWSNEWRNVFKPHKTGSPNCTAFVDMSSCNNVFQITKGNN